MSVTFSSNRVSFETLKRLTRCGFKPASAQMRPTLDGLMPIASRPQASPARPRAHHMRLRGTYYCRGTPGLLYLPPPARDVCPRQQWIATNPAAAPGAGKVMNSGGAKEPWPSGTKKLFGQREAHQLVL
jgi:hypothetical protein